MSATCTFCGGNLAPGVLHDPKQCAPERGLDFEKAVVVANEGQIRNRFEFKEWNARFHAELNAQHLAATAALRQEVALVRGAMRADDERLNNAAVKVWGENVHGCDAAEWMADEILSLRASHQEVIRVVREWQEARKALKGKPVARPFADSALVKNLRDAEAALAAWKGDE